MKQLYNEFISDMNVDQMIRDTTELIHIEMPQTYTAYGKVVQKVRQLMQDAGIKDTEIIDFPADGKTDFLDACSPLAWDASVGKLTLLPSGKVAADYTEHPFHLIQGSVSTPPGGLVAPIVTENDFHAGADVRGAMVMLNPLTWPRAGILTPILDRGGIGIICDFVTGRYKCMDQLQWVVACSESSAWHVTGVDRPFYGFSVKPEMGDFIRANPSLCRIECDGRRYEGKLPMVTGLIPGKSKKELWIFAHLYEPMLDDDSIGVVSGIEAARQILKKGTPEYSVRLVFAMEYYGFAAYAQMRGKNLKNEVIGGCNLDAILCVKDEALKMVRTGKGIPFIGNKLLHEAAETFKDELPIVEITGKYFDDLFIGDSTVGVPSVWIFGENGGFWHGSRQCQPDFIDPETFKKAAAIAAAFLCKWANDTETLPESSEVAFTLPDTPMRKEAAKTVFERIKPGFPKDLLNIPGEERRSLPGGIIYAPIANLLSRMDGKTDTATLLAIAESETGENLSDADVKKYLDILHYLADYGYLKAVKRDVITETDIINALQKLGVKESDLLLVHSSLSKCGHIAGGAETVLSALRKSAETVLFPLFNYSWCNLGGNVTHANIFRPYSVTDTKSIWTGSIPKHIVRNCPDVVRGKHLTHGWGGFGSRAAACVEAQAFDAPPTGKDSAPAKAFELGGKVLYFGTGLGCSTFLHYLEDCANVPYLAPAVCQYLDENGVPRPVVIPGHLPGHRDFYRKDAENCKFYTAAVKAGLQIDEVPLGYGKLQLIDLKQLYDIGMELLKNDPRILLCDDPECIFCRDAVK